MKPRARTFVQTAAIARAAAKNQRRVEQMRRAAQTPKPPKPSHRKGDA
jgi:hypothetical protein